MNIDDTRVYKKWWNIYNSYFLNDVLSYEEKGELIKAMCLRFEDGIELTDFNSEMVKLLYIQFISQVNRDDDDWGDESDQKTKAINVRYAYELYKKILKRTYSNEMKENISSWIMNDIVTRELLGYLFEITASSQNNSDKTIVELVSFCKVHNITTIQEYDEQVSK